METFYVPVPYMPAPTSAGGPEGLAVAGVILLVAAAVIAALLLLNRPARRKVHDLATNVPADLPKAA